MVFRAGSHIWWEMATLIFEINEGEFLLPLLDSGETKSQAIFLP